MYISMIFTMIYTIYITMNYVLCTHLHIFISKPTPGPFSYYVSDLSFILADLLFGHYPSAFNLVTLCNPLNHQSLQTFQTLRTMILYIFLCYII